MRAGGDDLEHLARWFADIDQKIERKHPCAGLSYAHALLEKKHDAGSDHDLMLMRRSRDAGICDAAISLGTLHGVDEHRIRLIAGKNTLEQ